MRPTRFGYFQPRSVDEAVGCLEVSGADARVLAGGQSLLAMMNRREVRPSVVVDLARVPGLRYVRKQEGVLQIGALTTHREVETLDDPGVRASFPIIPTSARLIGHLAVRTRGTFGGSIANADPCSEWCLIAVLLDAEILAVGPAGPRVIAARDFFIGDRQTALRWDEIVIEIRFPYLAPTAALVEFAVQEGSLPMVAAAAAVELDENGRVAVARIALAGVANRPRRMPLVERVLIGSVPGGALFDEVARLLEGELDPPGDPRADGQYRKEVAITLVARSLQASLELGASPIGLYDEEKVDAR